MEERLLFEETADSSLLHRGRVFELYSDKVKLPNGRESAREYISTNGAVAVVALTGDGSIVMERQYRYAQGRVVYEIPAGKLEKGEEPLSAAKRELEEETGIRAAEYVSLGVYMPSPAILREDIYVYLARGLDFGEAHLDQDEFLTVEAAPLDKLTDMIMSGEITDGKTVFGILKARLYLEGGR